VVTGRRLLRVEKQAAEGKDPKRRPVVSTREIKLCDGARKGSHGIIEIQVLCFR
jgi:hypothetical protein